MYNTVLVMSAIKGEFIFNSVFFFIYLFLDLDVYVLYQCSFGIFYAIIKVISFHLCFIYLKNMGKIFHKLLFSRI